MCHLTKVGRDGSGDHGEEQSSREFERRSDWSRRARVLPTVVVLIWSACWERVRLVGNPSSLPPPAGLPAFYSVPQPLPSGPPGTLIKSQKVAAAGYTALSTGSCTCRSRCRTNRWS